MVDLDLDVIRMRDGRIILDDEDEFEEHQVRYAYPPDSSRTPAPRPPGSWRPSRRAPPPSAPPPTGCPT